MAKILGLKTNVEAQTTDNGDLSAHEYLSSQAPGPSRLMSSLWVVRMGRDILGSMDKLAATYGDVTLLRVGRQSVVILRGAEVSRHVLVTAQDTYHKGPMFETLRPLLGEGLVTSSGETWRKSRRLVQPLFAKRFLGEYADHMSAAADSALNDWQRIWPAGRTVDLNEEILHVGLDTVGRALATHDFGATNHNFGKAMVGALHEVGEINRNPRVLFGQGFRRSSTVKAAKLATPRRWSRYLRETETVSRMIEELIDKRLKEGSQDYDDLLSLLIDARDEETGEPFSRQQVIDEVKTFIAAGHETTAHGLTWMFYLLAKNPDAEARLHQELADVLEGRIPTAEDAANLHWLAACFQEAMRVYPPVWQIPRIAGEHDEIQGYRIPKGARVLVSIWATHRDPAIYPDPERFDPERWMGDAPKERPRFSYLPFGGGKRACVGQGFALLNAQILGAMMAQRFRFTSASDAPVQLDPTITLRPLKGVQMIAHER